MFFAQRPVRFGTATLATFSVAILCVILTAGLWPFRAPTNDASWAADGTALNFYGHGSALSSAEIPSPNAKHTMFRSLEIWLEPEDILGSGTFLGLVKTEKQAILLQQDISDLTLKYAGRKIVIDSVFRPHMPVFITVTSDERRASIYVDGAFVHTAPDFPDNGLCGRLILGTSPFEHDGWRGRMRGLAFYSPRLTPASIAGDYRSWKSSGHPTLGTSPTALYLFNRRSGSTIPDEVAGGTALRLPSRYTLLHQTLFEAPWSEFHSSLSYWKDLSLNIIGFVPLGFLFCAWLNAGLRCRHPVVVTILIGATTSLTIEILQSFLPTRYSGTTDLMTNTLGTLIGALAYCQAGYLLKAFQ